MAKGIVRAVGALVVLSAAGIGGAWYMYSEKAVATAKQLMAAYEQLPLPNGSTAKLSYERVERTSFPNTGARFVNPVFEFSVPAGEQGQQAMLQTVKYQGPLDVVIDYVRSEVRLDTMGGGEMDIAMGEEKITAIWDTSDIHAMVKAKSREAFNQWGTIDLKDSASVTTAVRNVAAFSLAMGPMTIKDKTSGAMLFTQEALTSSLINRTATEKANVDFTLTMRAVEASPAYAQAMARLVSGSGLPEDADEQKLFSLAHAGKQDVEIDLTANMPDVPIGQPMPNGALVVRKFEIKNDFYVLSMPTEIILKEVEGQRKAFAKLKWQINLTAAGGEEMKRSVPMLTVTQSMLGNTLKREDVAVDPEVLNQKVLAALPNMSDLGPVTLALDIEAAIAAPAQQGKPDPVRHESIIIRDISFGHKRWGIDAKGQAARHEKVPPTVDITLNCKRCDTMTQDIFTMAGQMQDVMNFVTPERAQWDVSPELMARVNALLAEIGKKDDASGDIVFAIASPTPGEYRINDKPFAEAMMKVMALTAPAAPQDQAPAAGAAAQ